MVHSAEHNSTLFQAPIADLVKDKIVLVEADETCTAREALQIMRQYNIVAFPIYTTKCGWKAAGGVLAIRGDKQYLGIIGMFDLLHHIDMSFAKQEMKDEERAKLLKERMETPAVDIIGASIESQTLHIVNDRTKPLSSIIARFSEKEEFSIQPIHRCLVFNHTAEKDSPHMLTQSDILKHIHNNSTASSFPSGHKSLAACGLVDPTKTAEQALSNLVVGTEEFTAIECFTKMHHYGANAIPIVDKDRRIIANLSASDLRNVPCDELASALKKNVIEFMHQYVKSKLFLASETKGVPPPFTCTPLCTLAMVIESLVETRMHRIWVTDDEKRPLASITLSDLLHCVHTMSHTN